MTAICFYLFEKYQWQEILLEPPANSSIIFLKENPNRKIILEQDH